MAPTSMPVSMPDRSQTAANTSVARVAGAGAETAGAAVDHGRAGVDGGERVGDRQRQVLVAVEGDLDVGGQGRAQRRDAGGDAVGQQRPGGVGHVDDLGAGVGHDPRLLGQRLRLDHVRHHQEADRRHAQLAGETEVLGCDVGLGAVGGDAHDRGAAIVRAGEVLAACRSPGISSTASFAFVELVGGGRDQLAARRSPRSRS